MSSFNYFQALEPLMKVLASEPKDLHTLMLALPHLKTDLDLTDFKNTLVNLGFETKEEHGCVKTISPANMPALAIFKNNHAYLITMDKITGPKAFCLHTHEYKAFKDVYKKHALLLTFTFNQRISEIHKNWFLETLKRFFPFFRQWLGLGLLTSILGLASPFFLRSIYDWVIPTESTQTLYHFSIGLFLTFLGAFFLHLQKNKSLAYVGARLNMLISTEVLNKILYLPNHMVESLSVGAQVARIKQFDGVREIFTGPLAQAIVDIPFTLIFFAFLAWMGGVIILTPIIMSFIFVILIFIFTPIFQKASQESTQSFIKRQSFLVEAFKKIDTIKRMNLEQRWNYRFHDIIKENTRTQTESEHFQQIGSNIAQFVVRSGGLITIVWCAILVMRGDMTTGTLLAVVLLVSRALSPFQSLFMTLSRWHILKGSIMQMNQLLSLPQASIASQARRLDIKGHILMQNVGFRYPAQQGPPALNNITLEARPGEVVGIIGGNGSGKTSLIKVLLGLYPIQMGKCMIDHKDVGLYDGVSLRQSLSYAPHNPEVFHGTLAQNLRMVKAHATRKELEDVCEKVGLWSDIQELEMGLDTLVSEEIKDHFSFGFRQKLNLARAYLRDSRIMIFDEPGNAIDQKSDEKVHSFIKEKRGDKTFILVTHRPSLINLCDRILVLDQGNMRVFGPRQKALNYLKEQEEAA
jgi:ATP-binding cassette subfamily C protein/ATP-binding cassette subfamily C protein LapB